MSSANGAISTEQVFNLSEALEIVDGDMELLEEIASLFLEDYSAQLEQIREGIAQGDSVAVNRAAHSLKGSVANFAAKEAFEAAYRLEVLGQEGNLGDAEEAFADLDTKIKELKEALNAALG